MLDLAGVAEMASCVDPLVVGRVIGEVVDPFVPSVSMSVRYGTKHVNNGCNLKPSMSADPPSVQISGRSNDLYSLVCIYIYNLIFRWSVVDLQCMHV